MHRLTCVASSCPITPRSPRPRQSDLYNPLALALAEIERETALVLAHAQDKRAPPLVQVGPHA